MSEPVSTRATSDHEPLTEELLERLLASSSPEAYLANATIDDRSLADYLADFIEEHGLTRADVVRASAVNATFLYQIFSGARRASRDTIIKIAFGIGCTLRETQRLLRHAGLAELWSKNRRDVIIIHCIDAGHTRAECDDELYRLGEQTLLSREG